MLFKMKSKTVQHGCINFTYILKKKKITFNDITDKQGQSAYILVKGILQSSKF